MSWTLHFRGLARAFARPRAIPFVLALFVLGACAQTRSWEALIAEGELALEQRRLAVAAQSFEAAMKLTEGFDQADPRLDITLERLSILEMALMMRLDPPPKPLTVATPPSHIMIPYAPVPFQVPAAREGAFAVHLASFRSVARAKRGWRQLQDAFPKLLGGLSLTLEQTDLGDRGIYQRVLTGPFAEHANAGMLCAYLKARAQFCRVVRRRVSG